MLNPLVLNPLFYDDVVCLQYTLWLRLVEQVSLDLSVSLETKDKDQVRLKLKYSGNFKYFYDCIIFCFKIVNAYRKLTDLTSALKDSKVSTVNTDLVFYFILYSANNIKYLT